MTDIEEAAAERWRKQEYTALLGGMNPAYPDASLLADAYLRVSAELAELRAAAEKVAAIAPCTCQLDPEPACPACLLDAILARAAKGGRP